MQRVFVLGGVMLLAGLVSGAVGGAVVGYRVGHAPVPLATKERDQLRVALNEAQLHLSGAQSSLGSTQIERATLQARIDELERRAERAERETLIARNKKVAVVEVADAEVERSSTSRSSSKPARARLRVKSVSSDGKFVQLTDGTIYEIRPDSWSEAQKWVLGTTVRVTGDSGGATAFRIVNDARGEILHAELAADK